MVRARKISPVELVDAHLRQIEARGPALNAFVCVFSERARADAKQAEAAVARGEALGPLHGVPVTVKDSFDIAGQRTGCGSRFRADHRAATDATAVARLKSAGAIVLGKTNTPEFLSNYETDNFITGRTNNPWNIERTPGGSSGGEAAAIAAFCSAGGVGSDGGGSIRVPAHFTGIAGLKPTPGRVSAAGHFPVIEHPGGLLGVAGPMARSSLDVQALFAALAGYDFKDPFSAPVLVREPGIGNWGVENLRIGIWPRFYDVPVQPAIRAAVDDAARALASIGIHAEPFQPAGLERAPNLWWFFFGQLPAPFTQKVIEGREGDAHWTSTEFLRTALDQPAPTAEQVVTNLAIRDRMRTGLLRQMEHYPVLLTPPCGVAAFPHRSRKWSAGDNSIGLFQAMMPSTYVNLLGLPAMVIPFGVSEEGLPVGIQLVGRPYEEELLLDIAIRLEEARGPFSGPEGY